MVALGLATLGVSALVKILTAPRNEFGPDQPSERKKPPKSLAALDDWLKHSEAAVRNLRPGLAKAIIWHEQKHHRTPWSVVYIHGFSASRLETAPLADKLAAGLGANLFYTRLTGHGSNGQALGEATVQDWLADTLEALRIGQLLGEKVLIIGASTGATLATWLALRPEGMKVAAYVFLSPNFGLKNKRANIINAPWGQQLALAMQGPVTSSKISEPGDSVAWTLRYPTRALFPMMALVKKIDESNLALFHKPVMMLYSEQDETVDPAQIKAAFERIGTPYKFIKSIPYSIALGQHVLAGDIKDKNATRPMAAAILKWVHNLP